ncbi:tRNA methyltransferase 10 homolog C [Denticeps clupeoides]|uniref:tRNA methyltransferase 10 homolog C n=1 Tax=Denticeps clupeoides TaxID=299321 RepID=UPI0010A2DE29|nr:tRNA methyltransferase 10 homolog C [Denticeps clupeoides]
MRFSRLAVLGNRAFCFSHVKIECHRPPPSWCRFTSVCTRALATSSALRKDLPQPRDPGEMKIDLDIWKSVMRSQVAQVEALSHDDDEAGGEMSRVEATRELVDMWRQAGRQVPDQMTPEQLQMLADFTTKSAKKKYLKYLAIKEGHKKANKDKQEKRRMEKMVEKESREDEEGEDGNKKLRNSFVMQFWSRSLDRHLAWRGAQSMLFGQPLVFDMSYDQNMSRREMENTVSQLLESEGWNRRSVDPFHLHFCNLNPEGAYQRELLKRYGKETWERLMITASAQRHEEMFPREKLVYLTADSPNVLRSFDHNKVYIVGALVDRSIQKGVSLAHAKRLKLATARLPLDEYLDWDLGAKNLTLDQMIRILLTAKDTGSWKKALDFVPKRKHEGFYEDNMEVTRSSDAAGRGRFPLIKDKKMFAGKSIRSKGSDEHKPLPLLRPRMVLKNKKETYNPNVKVKRNWWEEE